MVNRLFAVKVFGSVNNAIGRYYKREDGTRVQVVGIAEDGKYSLLTEDPKPAMFLPFLQSPSNLACLVVRSGRDPRQLASEIRSRLRELDPSLPWNIQTWNQGLDIALFPSHVATVALGVLGTMGAMLSITGIFGMAAYSVSKRLREIGIRIALGAKRGRSFEGSFGPAREIAGNRVRDGIGPRDPRRQGVVLHRVSGKSSRSIGLGWRCSGHVVARPCGHVDSSAACPLRQSSDPAARGVSRIWQVSPGVRPCRGHELKGFSSFGRPS